MSFSSVVFGNSGDHLVEHSTARGRLGTLMIYDDGRAFRYAKAGAVALDIGKLMQESVVVSGHDVDLVVPTARAAGVRTITLTNSTTAITADQYKDGWLFVNDEAGEGQVCQIKSNTAESTGSGTVTITLHDKTTVALTTSSQCGLRKNKYDGVLVAPIAETGAVIGVTPIAVTESYYFWLQEKGTVAILTNGVVVVGEPVTGGGTTPGSIDAYNEDGANNYDIVGTVMTVGATGEYSLIDLRIG